MTPLAVALLTATALASEPAWLAKEVSPETISAGTSFRGRWKWLSANRFRQLGTVTEPGPDGAPRSPRHRLLDLEELSVIDLEVPYRAFPTEHLSALGIDQLQGAELVHHDGAVTTMLVDQMAGWKRIASFLVQYDHRAGRFSRLVKLGEIVPNHFLHHLGFDAVDGHYYFADVTTDDVFPAERAGGPVDAWGCLHSRGPPSNPRSSRGHTAREMEAPGLNLS